MHNTEVVKILAERLKDRIIDCRVYENSNGEKVITFVTSGKSIFSDFTELRIGKNNQLEVEIYQ